MRASKSARSVETGFSTQATAPASIERKAMASSCGSAVAVQMTIGSGCVSMMRRVASKPSSRGM